MTLEEMIREALAAVADRLQRLQPSDVTDLRASIGERLVANLAAPKITLFIVYGTSGEYSDRTEWNVAAYLDETQAAAARDELQAEFNSTPRESWDDTTYAVGTVPLSFETPKDAH